MNLRVPPHDKDAEIALTAAALRSTDALDHALEYVHAEHFYDDSLKDVFRAATELRAEGRPVDAITVASRLATEDKLERLELLADHGESVIEALSSYRQDSSKIGFASFASTIEAYAQLVRERHMLRALIQTCTDAIEKAPRCGNVGELLSDVAEVVANLASFRSASSLSTLASPLDGEIEKIRYALETGTTIGTSTGIGEVDRIIGGLFAGELYVVAGRPAMGKTGIAVNMLTSAAERGEGVFLASLEMPSGQVAMRIACGAIGISYERFRQGRCTHAEFARLAAQLPRVSQLPFIIDDQPAIPLSELRAKVRKAERRLASMQQELRIVAVDYIQLMHGTAETREQEISAVTRGLKQLAKEFQVPIIALSQLNRGVESRPDKRPLMSDLRESGAIEQDADSILMLYRDDYYNPQSRRPGVSEIVVQKSRNGATGTIFLAFDKEFTRFRDLTSAERLQSGLDNPYNGVT